jgi:hypothetical protein
MKYSVRFSCFEMKYVCEGIEEMGEIVGEKYNFRCTFF